MKTPQLQNYFTLKILLVFLFFTNACDNACDNDKLVADKGELVADKGGRLKDKKITAKTFEAQPAETLFAPELKRIALHT